MLPVDKVAMATAYIYNEVPKHNKTIIYTQVTKLKLSHFSITHTYIMAELSRFSVAQCRYPVKLLISNTEFHIKSSISTHTMAEALLLYVCKRGQKIVVGSKWYCTLHTDGAQLDTGQISWTLVRHVSTATHCITPQRIDTTGRKLASSGTTPSHNASVIGKD